MGPRWEEEGRKRSGGPQVYLKGTDMRVRFKGRGLEVSATEHSCGRHGLAFISTSAPVSFAKVVLQAVGIVTLAFSSWLAAGEAWHTQN